MTFLSSNIVYIA